MSAEAGPLSHLPQYVNNADPEDPDVKDNYRDVRIKQVCQEHRYLLQEGLTDALKDDFRQHTYNRSELSP